MSVTPTCIAFLLVLASLADAFIPLYDQHFGLGVLPSGPNSFFSPFSVGYCRPWYHQSSESSGISKTVNDKNTFKIYLDVQHFKPDEIKVKVIDDYVQVEGKHEERKDEHGFISREFVRRYSLPEGAELDALVSELSSDGILIISAPKKALPESQNERIVPITQTNTPVLEQTKQLNEKAEVDKSEKQKDVEKDKS